MVIFITILHVIMCLILVAIVLLQTGKGANMGAAFGGASNTIFGGAGPASFLNRVTTIAAVMFMLTSFTLAILSSRGRSSSKVLDAAPVQQTQPVTETATPVTEEQQESESAPVSENSQEENQKTE